MKLHKIISKNKDGEKAEAIIQDKDGRLKTAHIKRTKGTWWYHENKTKIGLPIYKSLEE